MKGYACNAIVDSCHLCSSVVLLSCLGHSTTVRHTIMGAILCLKKSFCYLPIMCIQEQRVAGSPLEPSIRVHAWDNSKEATYTVHVEQSSPP